MSEKMTREQIEEWRDELADDYQSNRLAVKELTALCDLALAGLEVQQRLSNRIKALEDDGKQRTAVGDALLAELKTLASLPEPK